jgi:hypothetical protein
MRTYTQLQKGVSVLMIFVLMVHFSGCTSTRVVSLSKSNLPHAHSDRYAYIIHGEKYKYLIKNWAVSNDTLSGKIDQIYSDKSFDFGRKIHLYFSSDSVIKIDKEEFLIVPFDEITKTELQTKEVHGVGTTLIVIGCILGVVLVVGIISALTTPWHIFDSI